MLNKKTNVTKESVINNIKQIELTKMATFKNIAFKNNAIRDNFVANFKDLIKTAYALDKSTKTPLNHAQNQIAHESL